MKFNDSLKNILVNSITYLYILLFVYASVSKLLEFGDFQTQLGQSPLLGAFASPISYAVPGFEFLISLLLSIKRTKLLGFYLSFTLMVIFTAYIIIILNFTSFTPCSCGGVLEELGWTEHLIFNLFFILLAIMGIWILDNKSKKKVLLSLTGLLVLGSFLVFLVYLLSEKEIKQNNAFQRKYIPHGLEKLGNFQLESNAFYIAGIDDSMIYLGNYDAPKLIKAISRDLKRTESFNINLENYNFPFTRTRIEIHPPYFFLGDGTVPIIFKGQIKNPMGRIYIHDLAYFHQFKPISTSEILFSAISSESKSNILGLFEKVKDSVGFCLAEDIIKNRSGGAFESDGILLWSKILEKAIYVYYYSNKYEVADRKLNFLWQGKTIDTISRAQVNVAHYSKNNAQKIGKATTVNLSASVWGKNLFINTERMGKYETAETLKSASIIDQYDFLKNEYVQSFYFYHQYNRKLKEFRVINDTIIGLVDNQLWSYKIKQGYR